MEPAGARFCLTGNAAKVRWRFPQLPRTAQPMRLKLWHRLAIESCCDRALVEINAGAGWINLASFNTNVNTWTQVSIPLTGYLGQPNLMVRFRFTTDGSVTYDGWNIDDVVVGP